MQQNRFNNKPRHNFEDKCTAPRQDFLQSKGLTEGFYGEAVRTRRLQVRPAYVDAHYNALGVRSLVISLVKHIL
jgi:hypothetical protein